MYICILIANHLLLSIFSKNLNLSNNEIKHSISRLNFFLYSFIIYFLHKTMHNHNR